METQEEKKIEETRETIELITPGKKYKIVMYSYITGYETRQIRKYGIGDEKDLDKAENEMIKVLVVSINESKENILDTVLKMGGKDYVSVIEKASGIIKEDFLDQAENTKEEK